jgi:hypothetical protein
VVDFWLRGTPARLAPRRRTPVAGAEGAEGADGNGSALDGN